MEEKVKERERESEIKRAREHFNFIWQKPVFGVHVGLGVSYQNETSDNWWISRRSGLTKGNAVKFSQLKQKLTGGSSINNFNVGL